MSLLVPFIEVLKRMTKFIIIQKYFIKFKYSEPFNISEITQQHECKEVNFTYFHFSTSPVLRRTASNPRFQNSTKSNPCKIIFKNYKIFNCTSNLKKIVKINDLVYFIFQNIITILTLKMFQNCQTTCIKFNVIIWRAHFYSLRLFVTKLLNSSRQC